MNITRERRNLVSKIENKRWLNLEDRTVDSGERVFITAYRRHEEGETEWYVDDVTRHGDGYMIGTNPGEQQMVLDATVNTYSRTVKLKNLEVVEKYPIKKPKSNLKEMFCELWELGWDEFRISPSKHRTVTVPDGPSEDTRLPKPEDFKITTVSGRDKDAHLGVATSNGYMYKLGMKWRAWHRYNPTNKLFILSHELVHCRHHHHREQFYLEHARLISSISETESDRERVGQIIGGDIHWNRLKSNVLHSVNDNREIPSREQRNETRDKMGEILEYPYGWGEKLYLYPPMDALTPEWFHDVDDFTTRDDMMPDDVVEMPINDVEFPSESTDEELVDHLNSFKRDFDHYHKYVFDADSIPVIDSDGTVVENRLFAQMYQQMIRSAVKINKWSGEITDETIPVRYA